MISWAKLQFDWGLRATGADTLLVEQSVKDGTPAQVTNRAGETKLVCVVQVIWRGEQDGGEPVLLASVDKSRHQCERCGEWGTLEDMHEDVGRHWYHLSCLAKVHQEWCQGPV
jgi:hypothetical protein